MPDTRRGRRRRSPADPNRRCGEPRCSPRWKRRQGGVESQGRSGSCHRVHGGRFQNAVEESAGPKPLDVVYDGVGADTFMKGLDLLRPRGMMVTFGNASGPVPEIAPLLLSQRDLFLTRPSMGHYLLTTEELLSRSGDVFAWIQSGERRCESAVSSPRRRRRCPSLEGRQTTGKVLLLP